MRTIYPYVAVADAGPHLRRRHRKTQSPIRKILIPVGSRQKRSEFQFGFWRSSLLFGSCFRPAFRATLDITRHTYIIIGDHLRWVVSHLHPVAEAWDGARAKQSKLSLPTVRTKLSHGNVAVPCTAQHVNFRHVICNRLQTN